MLYPPQHSSGETFRVAVTGAGIITAHGNGWAENSEGFRTGKNSLRPVTLFDTSRQRTSMAAEVRMPNQLPPNFLTPSQIRKLGRSAKLLLFATHEAFSQAGWKNSAELPFVVATTAGGMSYGEAFFRQAIGTPANTSGQAGRILLYQPHTDCLLAQRGIGFSGPTTIVSNACASGANAVGHGWELVRHGAADRVLAGGYDALCHLTFAGFDSLQALSKTRCNPFDAAREGLTLGEGAAMLALERWDLAMARGANILGEIAGYGMSTDIHHLTQPQPDGSAALASMRAACESAGIGVESVDYVNAHGTATIHNDAAEARAINAWAGELAPHIHVSSTKCGIGHLLGGAGAVEAVVSLMTLCGQWLPPQPNLNTPDPVCRFKIIREPEKAPVETVLSNSFGFGGANASLLFRKAR